MPAYSYGCLFLLAKHKRVICTHQKKLQHTILSLIGIAAI